MKICVIAVLCLAAPTWAATHKPIKLNENEVLFLLVSGEYRTGDVVPRTSLSGFDILYTNKPCGLNLRDAADMRYWTLTYNHVEGCWFPTQDGGYTLITAFGSVMHRAALFTFAHGIADSDLNVTITEPHFYAATHYREAVNNHAAALNRALNAEIQPR